MKLIALSGGIAAGKSTIAEHLRSRGAVHIDADLLAREAVAPASRGLKAITERFGPGVLSSDGSLDRAKLGSLVFHDERELTALNQIVHPEVRKLAEAKIAAAVLADPEAIIVYDVPLLVEASVDLPWDLIVIAEAPEETRIRRMVSLRGMSEEEAKRRVRNQASDDARRAVADVIIDTSTTEAHTIEQTDMLWERLQEVASNDASQLEH